MTHCRLWQAWWFGQSLLWPQPYSSGAAGGQKEDFYPRSNTRATPIHLLIFSQRTSPWPLKPSWQVQDMVLRGRVSKTLQSALATHGLISRQGLRQSPEKQASWLGHSPSVWQPLGSGGGTGKDNLGDKISYSWGLQKDTYSLCTHIHRGRQCTLCGRCSSPGGFWHCSLH